MKFLSRKMLILLHPEILEFYKSCFHNLEIIRLVDMVKLTFFYA